MDKTVETILKLIPTEVIEQLILEKGVPVAEEFISEKAKELVKQLKEKIIAKKLELKETKTTLDENGVAIAAKLLKVVAAELVNAAEEVEKA